MSLTSEEQARVISGCLKNDRRSQELLYREFYGRMLSMCMRYSRDRDKAKEILNRGFLEVFKSIANYSGQGSLEGWIRVVILRSLGEYFRRNAKYSDLIQLVDKDEFVEEEGLYNLYEEDLRKMINLLPKATRVVFNLHVIEGYTHEEIAAALSISAGTSKWHLSDARKKLQKMLKKSKVITGYE